MNDPESIPMVRPAAMIIARRLLVESIALCMETGQSASEVRHTVLQITDYLARDSGCPINSGMESNQKSVRGRIYNLSALVSLIEKKV